MVFYASRARDESGIYFRKKVIIEENRIIYIQYDKDYYVNFQNHVAYGNLQTICKKRW